MNESRELEMGRDPRITRALREAAREALPADFAARLAARAAEADAAPFENALMVLLVAALGISTVLIVMRFGDQWRFDADAIGWVVALAGCLGASWVMNRLFSGSPSRAAPARP